MNWILTNGGQEFDLPAPKPGAILLSDIAHALSQINRFTGHACRPYSVAEHSLLVLDICERKFRLGVGGLFAALMHDAHEAYCGDVATPIKRVVGDAWDRMEGRLKRAVRSAFALHAHHGQAAALIKQADLIALSTERQQLLPPSSPWQSLHDVPAAEWVDLMDKGRCGMTWMDWRGAFAARADELDFARDAAPDA